MHQTMRIMFHTIDSAGGDDLPRLVLFAFRHVALQRPEAKHFLRTALRCTLRPFKTKSGCLCESGNRARVAWRRPNSLKVRVFSNIIHFFHQPEFQRTCALAARRQLRSLADENFLLHVMGLVFEFVDAGISGALPADKDVSGSH